jgi:hypothetical protein
MVLPSTGEISWSNMANEYGIIGQIGIENIRAADKRVPQSNEVSSSNFYGLYSYPTNSNVLYLEASNAISYPGSGSTWFDLSGVSNNFSIPASGFTWSNNGIFRCGANATSGMIGPTSDQFNINVDHTLEFVAQGNTGLSNTSFIMFTSSTPLSVSDNRMLHVHLPFGNGLIYYDVRGCCTVTHRISVTEPNPNTTIKHYVFRCRTSTTPNREIFINGSNIANSGANGTSTEGTWGGISRLFNAANGSMPWAGNVHYVRIYNRAFSDNEISSLFNTMKDKYNI